jgi:hypothetical protein
LLRVIGDGMGIAHQTALGVRKLVCALCRGSLLPRNGITTLQVLPHSSCVIVVVGNACALLNARLIPVFVISHLSFFIFHLWERTQFTPTRRFSLSTSANRARSEQQMTYEK